MLVFMLHAIYCVRFRWNFLNLVEICVTSYVKHAYSSGIKKENQTMSKFWTKLFLFYLAIFRRPEVSRNTNPSFHNVHPDITQTKMCFQDYVLAVDIHHSWYIRFGFFLYFRIFAVFFCDFQRLFLHCFSLRLSHLLWSSVGCFLIFLCLQSSFSLHTCFPIFMFRDNGILCIYFL